MIIRLLFQTVRQAEERLWKYQIPFTKHWYKLTAKKNTFCFT